MAKYRKKAIMVTAIPAEQDQYVTTLEGVSEAKKGDYIVTGVDNEQWAIKPKWFHGAYTHIEGDTYQRKPQILEAVQIDEPDVVSAPTGDINGDPGDYKVTGTSGEQWFVKPDIFEKTYEKLNGGKVNMDKKHPMEDVIKSIGIDGAQKYLPKGMKLLYCDLHGHYLQHYKTDGLCPLCVAHDAKAEGTTATEVEHYINIRDLIDPTNGTNPGQKANPYGVQLQNQSIEKGRGQQQLLPFLMLTVLTIQ